MYVYLRTRDISKGFDAFGPFASLSQLFEWTEHNDYDGFPIQVEEPEPIEPGDAIDQFNSAINQTCELKLSFRRRHRDILKDNLVYCKFCNNTTGAAAAHLHDGMWVCEECWDARLKATE